MALFVTFEGIEGSGKSTQSRLLYEWFIDNGYEVVLTREPGGTPKAEEIRRILLSHSSEIFPEQAELLLYMAARSFHVENLIKPSLNKGATVICDRFFDATVAYQGFGRGLDIELISRLNMFVLGGILPDLTFLIDVPVDVGMSRLGSGGKDRIESEDYEFHDRIRSGYLKLSELYPDRIKVIDGRLDIETVFEKVIECIKTRL